MVGIVLGGPPWLNGAAVRAGFATLAAAFAVLGAWFVAWIGQPLAHAVVWPLFGLLLGTVGRAVWRDTARGEASTASVAAETMMIVVGVAAAIMGSTAALGSPNVRSAGAPSSVLGEQASRSVTTIVGVDQAVRAAGAGVSAAIAQLGVARFGPTTTTAATTTTSTEATTTTSSSTTTIAAVVPDGPVDSPTPSVTGSQRVPTTTRAPNVGGATSVARPTTTVRTGTVASTAAPPTTPPTTPPPTTPVTQPPTTPATTTPPTTVAPTTVAPTTTPPTTG